MSLLKQSLQYCRILPRRDVKEICNRDSVSKEFLEEIFGVKIITKEQEEYFAEIFLHDCESLLDTYFDKKYKSKLKQNVKNAFNFIYTKTYSKIDKVFTIKENENLERLINFMYFLLSCQMSWSVWLLCVPTGQKLLTSVFTKYDLESIVSLSKILIRISVLEEYDNIFFREQFDTVFTQHILNLAKDIRKYGITYMEIDFSDYYSKWLANIITTETFYGVLIAFVNLLKSKMNNRFGFDTRNSRKLKRSKKKSNLYKKYKK